MSLDVYLEMQDAINVSKDIYIRENVQNKKISREEWDRRFPDKEPFTVSENFSHIVYQGNITHNLNTMADQAGLYYCMWRPEEKGYTKAKQLINPLIDGIKFLKEKPGFFKKFNPENGWGTYEGLLAFAEEYLEACKQYPEADVSVWR